MYTTRRKFIGFVLASTAVVGRPAWAQAQSAPLSIVATTSMIGDAARQVGGDLVDVTSLMGPGVDPHSYRQTRSDIVSMTRADLVLWHGLYLEAQMEDFLLKLAKRGTVVAVGEAVPKELLIGHLSYEGRYDPHIWMVPDLWTHVVRAVQQALTETAPEHAAAFAANAAVHLADVARLETYAKTTTATVPAQDRVLLTAHDAFGYFGRAYGVEVIGIQGISTESEAGLNRISTLVDMLVARDIRAVFVESSVSDRNIRALVEGAAAQGHKVQIGGELYSDAMGEPGTYEGTYIGMIDHNVTTIAAALGGDVSARGMNARLSADS